MTQWKADRRGTKKCLAKFAMSSSPKSRAQPRDDLACLRTRFICARCLRNRPRHLLRQSTGIGSGRLQHVDLHCVYMIDMEESTITEYTAIASAPHARLNASKLTDPLRPSLIANRDRRLACRLPRISASQLCSKDAFVISQAADLPDIHINESKRQGKAPNKPRKDDSR